MTRELHIGVMGAGAIGSFVGGMLVSLQDPNVTITFLGRTRGKAEVLAHGMTLEDLENGNANGVKITPEKIHYETDVNALASCDIVLVAVKSAQSKETGAALASILKDNAIVVSMQNGLHNADVLRAEMPKQKVLGGIVGFNVVARENGLFRRATTGPLAFEHIEDARLTALAELLQRARFQVELPKNIRAKQWSKLVMNLNNAVSALSGAPTRDLIFDPGYRRIVRAVAVESLGVMRAAKIKPARVGPLPVSFFPTMLALPTALLKIVAGAQLKIDPEARSSMWQDLSKNKPTEVDDLNGEIVRLAETCGAHAPINARLVALVHEAEKAQNGSPNFSADVLWEKLHAS